MVSARLYCLLLLSSVCAGNLAHAQRATVVFYDTHEKIKCPITSTDSLSAPVSLAGCLRKLHYDGYIAARIDSILLSEQGIVGFGYKGPLYKWKIENPDSNGRRRPGSFTSLNGKPVSPDHLQSVSNRIIADLENNGFPFARVSITEAHIDSGTVSITPVIDPGAKILWDSLYVKGNAKINQRFIRQFVGFSGQTPFSYSYFGSLSKRLAALPFIGVIRSPELEFVPGRSNIYVYLTKTRASRFSGMIGMNSKGDSWADVQLTGDINLLLRNAFSNGEEFSFRWNAPGEGTQRLHVSSLWPYIAGSNFGVDTEFNLHKQDTSYLTIKPRLAVKFHSRTWLLGVGVQSVISRVIKKQPLTQINDYSVLFYQFTLQNYLHSVSPFPQAGFWFDASVGAGTQRATSDDTGTKSSILHYQAKIALVQPIAGRLLLIKLANTTEGIEKWNGSYGALPYFNNELVRIGGSKLLRGFNEESILANRFSIGSVELHFLLQQQTSLFGFYDIGRLSARVQNAFSYEWAMGIGAGLMLNVGEGTINLTYALGKGFGENLQFTNAKVHIGYSVKF